MREMQLQGLGDMVLATAIIPQVRNSFPRPNGRSPCSWVLGVSEITITGSLLDDEETEGRELPGVAQDCDFAFVGSLGIRESARVAQIRLDDNDSRVRAFLLHQSRSTRGPYTIGSYIYFDCVQTRPAAVGSSRK